MSVRTLLSCLSGLCALVSIMALAATVAPHVEPHRYVVVCSGAVGAVVFGVAAARAQVDQSVPQWAAWTVFAIVFILVMISVG